MKKLYFVLFLIACSRLVSAGEYYSQGRIDIYAPDGQRYFRGVTGQIESGGMFSSRIRERWTKNVRVFDLQSGESWKIFPEDHGSENTVVSLEFPPSGEDSTTPYRQRMGNFRNLESEATNGDIVVLVTRNTESEQESIFVADKEGRNPREIAVVQHAEDWHLDQRHMKLRVFGAGEDDLTMKEYNLLDEQ